MGPFFDVDAFELYRVEHSFLIAVFSTVTGWNWMVVCWFFPISHFAFGQIYSYNNPLHDQETIHFSGCPP